MIMVFYLILLTPKFAKDHRTDNPAQQTHTVSFLENLFSLLYIRLPKTLSYAGEPKKSKADCLIPSARIIKLTQALPLFCLSTPS